MPQDGRVVMTAGDVDGGVVADAAVVDTDGDGVQDPLVTGQPAAVFPVDPLA